MFGPAAYPRYRSGPQKFGANKQNSYEEATDRDGDRLSLATASNRPGQDEGRQETRYSRKQCRATECRIGKNNQAGQEARQAGPAKTS